MNRATRTIVAIVGVVLAIGGLAHGIPEILQGSKPTEGFIIQAIGPEMDLWGTEEAFTVLPTYLSTGIAAVTLSLALIVWSVGFVHRRHGTTVLVVLYLGLFVFGGGIAAQVMFAPFVCVAATRIHNPLTWWRRVLPGVTDDETILAVCWAFVFGGGLGLYLLSFVAGFAHDVERANAD